MIESSFATWKCGQAIGRPDQPADWSTTSPAQLVESHLARPRNTSRAYRADLATFREFLIDGSQQAVAECPDEVAAVRWFVSLPGGAVQRVMHNYVHWLRERYEAPNSGCRKAQSLMGLLQMAAKFHIIGWRLEPLRLPPRPLVRDTKGPPPAAFRAMVERCERRGDPKGARDLAMLRLMGTGAYRCNEVLSLDVRHVDIQAREVEILAKGLWGRITHPVPMEAAEAIGRWLKFRGAGDGPLFTTRAEGVDGEERPERLSYEGAYHVIRTLGKAAGVRCSPHKLRHFAITECLRRPQGNVLLAMAMARHRDANMTLVYANKALDDARNAMELVSRGVTFYRSERATKDN